MRFILMAVLSALSATNAQARVVSATPQGFEVSETVTVGAPPAVVYAALIEVGRWWDDAHSYSGKAANLTLSPRLGGCLCEAMGDGGAVEHLRVVYVRPGQAIRLRGGLGPIQLEGAEGAFTWSLKPAGEATELTQSYVVGGYVRGGAEKMAPLVDRVLATQIGRLKRFAETGSSGAPESR